jgi:hypothetical protein
MAQGDYLIQNQSFPSFRSDLNSTLEAINTSNSGTSRPTSAVAGTVWLDTTSASTPTLKFYDGSDDISLATLDYTANTVNWLDSTVSVNIVSDTTPQLGGNLDVNGNSIVSVANGNITITPDGTGKLVVSGLSYPTADGTNGQALITDGSGNLSFGDVAGGTNWQSSIVTGTTLSAVAGNGYWIDTTSNACTVTLPASASVGDTIEFSDYARNWGTNNVTINPNSLNFQGNSSPNPVYDVNGQSVRIVYSGATQGWIPSVDDDVTLETPQTVDAEYLVVAGGGSGAKSDAGGGGAGGLLTNYGGTAISLNPGTTYTATVGAGGASKTSVGLGNDGSDSVISGTGISTVTAIGGGGGGYSNTAGGDGGSGGGAGIPGAAGSGTVGQGNDGGSSTDSAPEYGGGGGGGAGAVGGNGTANNGGDGGNGLSNSIIGSATTYAGGGGGQAYQNVANAGAGGSGGGGAGDSNGIADSGTDGLGGGGGGCFDNGTSGAGGSGVVILRVPTANYSGTTTGSPTVTTDGTDTIIKFTGSGSYTA